ncbi:GNAT family N-acetyltransferase [Shouchella clausii]|uniref:GNAT family N-acetyltransferase n=1 Tax=Shouchella clausii TaxID=79880 RepID=UPI00280AE307|nr:GNAT family N-acetyltransferase [Shouchella clausii]WMM32977.1 GNAT family N-acetyltransferase [Shouchella clausii]
MIRQGTLNDLPQIEQIAIDATKQMNLEGSDQWTSAYPTAAHFQEDIEQGTLYVYLENMRIVGSISIDQNLPVEFNESQLSWKTKHETAGTFHRLVVDPAAQQSGVAVKLVQFAESLCREQGLASLKMDTYSKNKKAQKLFAKLGYKPVGTFYYPNKKDPFFAYEKALT